MAGTSIPKNIKATLFIDGKPASNTMKALEADARRCLLELKNLERGTDAWNKKMKELQSHRRELAGLNAQINETAGLFGFLKTEVGKFGALAAGYLGFSFITDEFRNIIMGNAELSDSFADVRKTTGLTEEGIRRLAQEFKKLDTRTSQQQLLGLAEIAGKLGVSGERDVLAFVRAADKINVALGKDLGDAESAINDIGKLVELFKVKDAYGLEDSMIRTGSAINALGAAGTASEAKIVEFTKRLGGIAPQANFSIESILGLAATMDELGQPVEASATAIGQFITGIGSDLPGFAKIAGMSVKDFSKLLKEDGNQALLEVLKNLKSTGQGVEGLANKMNLVGEEGSKAIATLGALSNNLDLLVTRQKLANDEFAKGTSLQNEFNVKNENFASVLEKTGKTLKSFTSNAVFTDFLKNMVVGFKDLLDWGNQNMSLIVNLTKLILVGAIAWGSYRAAILLTNFGLDAYAARIVLARTASLAFAGAQALLYGNTMRAQAAMRALNLTTSANPYIAVTTALITLIAAIALFSKTTTEAEKIQEGLNNVEAEAAKNRNDELETIKQLKEIIDSETASREQKLSAVDRLRKVMPDALKDLKDEEILTTKGTIAINKYIKALEEKTLAEAAQSKIRKLQERNIEIENGAINDTTIWQDVKSFAGSGNINQFREKKKGFGQANAKDELDANKRQIKAIQEKYGAGMVNNLLDVDDVTTGGSGTGGLTGGDKEQEFNYTKDLIDKMNDAYASALAKRLEENEQEEKAIVNKYAALKREAEQNILDNTLLKQAKVAIKKAENAELETLRQKNLAADIADGEKQQAEAEKIYEDFLKEELDIREQLFQAGLNEREREIRAVDLHYQELVKLAELYGVDTINLYGQWAEAKAQIDDKFSKNSKKKDKEDKNELRDFVVQSADQLGSAISQISANNRQAETDASIKNLEERRDKELANKNLTEKQKDAINKKYDAQVKSEKLKAWRADHQAALKQAVIQGALNALKGFWRSGLLGVAGAAVTTLAQIGVIAAQKPPQYATGGYSDNDPEGYIDQQTFFRRSATGRPFIAGEAGREWIAPNWMLQNPRTANIIGMLEAARQEKRAFASGGFNGPAEVSPANPGYDFSKLESMVVKLADTISKVDSKQVYLPLGYLEDQQAIKAQILIDGGG